jgi:hypothetical protein
MLRDIRGNREMRTSVDDTEELQNKVLERLSGKPNGLTVYRKVERNSPINRRGVVDLHISSPYTLGEDFFAACKYLEELGLVLTQKQTINEIDKGETVTLVVATLTKSGSSRREERHGQGQGDE